MVGLSLGALRRRPFYILLVAQQMLRRALLVGPSMRGIGRYMPGQHKDAVYVIVYAPWYLQRASQPPVTAYWKCSCDFGDRDAKSKKPLQGW